MEIKTVTYQCPNCNAALEYDNSLGKFRCFYCDGVFEERDIKNLFRDNEQMALDENEARSLLSRAHCTAAQTAARE